MMSDIPAFVMAGVVATALLLALQAVATVCLWKPGPSATKIAWALWSASGALVVSIPVFVFSVVLTMAAYGWSPALIGLGLVGWSALLLVRAVQLRRSAHLA